MRISFWFNYKIKKAVLIHQTAFFIEKELCYLTFIGLIFTSLTSSIVTNPALFPKLLST